MTDTLQTFEDGRRVASSGGSFYNYMSCIEEKRYCDQPALVVGVLRQAALFGPITVALAQRYQIDFEDELCGPALAGSDDVSERRAARVVQLALYVLAASEIRRTMTIKFTSGYSMGYAAAYIEAGLLTLEQVLDGVVPGIRRYNADNLAALRRRDLSSMMVADFGDPGVAAYVCDLLARQYSEVRVKDFRTPHALWLVGPAQQIDDLRCTVFRDKPGAISASTPVTVSDSSHFDAYAYPDVLLALRSLAFKTPTLDVHFHFGEPIRAGVPPADAGGALFGAVFCPLSMDSIYQQMRRSASPIVMFGSKRVTQFALFGAPIDADNSNTLLHWEDLVLSNEADLPLALNQRS